MRSANGHNHELLAAYLKTEKTLTSVLTMLDRSSIMMCMNRLNLEKRCSVIRCLVDGCSVRATTRITGVAKNTIQKLTRDLGEACLNFQDHMLQDLPCQRLQVDEVWNFCYAKDKNLPDNMKGMPGVGSMWTWTALCDTTKLLVSWQLGARDAATAYQFMADIQSRLANRVQLSADGNTTYLEAVESTFGAAIDFGQIVKIYGNADSKPETRYSPAKCLGTKRKRVTGDPAQEHISTSYVERQNLNIRMQNRRFTRLTNAFSKKADMLAYSIAIMFSYHNFVRKHQTIKTTPAVKAGIVDRVWSIENLVELTDIPMFQKKDFSN